MPHSSEILYSLSLVPSLQKRIKKYLKNPYSKGITDQRIIKIWPKKFLKSDLPYKRQIQILEDLKTDIRRAEEWQKKVENKEDKDKSPLQKDKAQWTTIATTSRIDFNYESQQKAQTKIDQLENLKIPYEIKQNKKGHTIVHIYGFRVSYAFHKKMCSYKKDHKSGCRFCMLPSINRNVKSITGAEQVKSLEDALEKSKKAGNRRTTFEILSDGSFLNTCEVSQKTQEKMMEKLAKQPFLQRIAIETRPEFCTPKGAKKLLKTLREDQQLNIYFGLESADEFINAIIHKKGYILEEFENIVKKLDKTLTKNEKKRLKISAYSIVKPAYLSEQEAIASAIKMAQKLNKLKKIITIDLDIKYEPCVVSAGSIQDYLFHQKKGKKRRYYPPSYFSIAELIAQLILKKLHHQAKVGQRDDIDNFSAVSMVPQIEDENLFSQFDFLVYNAVQRFNNTKNPRQFAIDMRIPIKFSKEFKKWENFFYGKTGDSALSKLLKKELGKTKMTKKEIKKENFQKQLWKVADDIEYNKKFSKILREKGLKAEKQVKEEIKKLCKKQEINLYDIKDLDFIDTGDKNKKETLIKYHRGSIAVKFHKATSKAAYQTEIIIMNEDMIPQSLWIKIPLKTTKIPEKPKFIY